MDTHKAESRSDQVSAADLHLVLSRIAISKAPDAETQDDAIPPSTQPSTWSSQDQMHNAPTTNESRDTYGNPSVALSYASQDMEWEDGIIRPRSMNDYLDWSRKHHASQMSSGPAETQPDQLGISTNTETGRYFAENGLTRRGDNLLMAAAISAKWSEYPFWTPSLNASLMDQVAAMPSTNPAHASLGRSSGDRVSGGGIDIHRSRGNSSVRKSSMKRGPRQKPTGRDALDERACREVEDMYTSHLATLDEARDMR
ncbi:hypothetical protein IAU59_006325 [Kwoniella sp. CBS 9459]